MDVPLILLRVVHVSPAEPTESQRERLARADRRLRLATRIDLQLILFAALTMAIGRSV